MINVYHFEPQCNIRYFNTLPSVVIYSNSLQSHRSQSLPSPLSPPLSLAPPPSPAAVPAVLVPAVVPNFFAFSLAFRFTFFSRFLRVLFSRSASSSFTLANLASTLALMRCRVAIRRFLPGRERRLCRVLIVLSGMVRDSGFAEGSDMMVTRSRGRLITRQGSCVPGQWVCVEADWTEAPDMAESMYWDLRVVSVD